MTELAKAQILFSEIVARVIKRWTFVSTFRSTAQHALFDSAGTLAVKQRQLLQDLLESSEGQKAVEPLVSLIALANQEVAPPKLVDSLAPYLTQGTLANTQIAVDTASIIFAHSIVDAAALDFCRVTALAAPMDWEESISKKKISLAELKNVSYEEILNAKLEKVLWELDGESLLTKAGVLFARCKPPANFSPMENYEYDKGRLEQIDTLRHEIVHGDRCDKGVPNIEDDVDYLFLTALFFVGLVNHRYGLNIDSQVVGKTIMGSFYKPKPTRDPFYGA